MDSFALPAPKQKPGKSADLEGTNPKEEATEFKVPSVKAIPSEETLENRATTEVPPPPPLNYDKPVWSGLPKQIYHFEVIKGGLIIETLELAIDKEFLVVGRLPFCDVSLEHPSVSRYHAIVQFQSSGEIYLYDLKSAQGTRVNKESIAPRKYHRIRVGDQIRFGQSTRLFILQGVEEDVTTEPELQPTQEQDAGEDYGSWSLGEGDMEEEKLLALADQKFIEDENIFYRKDPKKALKNFLENQGEEMEFEVEQEGSGTERMYLARVKLPLFENAAYGIGKDFKKKDAEKQAALDACIKLDKMGILRNSNDSELAKIKNRMKELLGDDDDSDEDSFYDRTKTTGKSKQKKPLKKGEETVETYASLTEKKSELQAKIEALSNKISESIVQAEQPKDAQSEGDDLDEYMASLGRDIKGEDINVLKKQLEGMHTELQKLDRLIEIAKPTDLFASLSTKTASVPQNTTENSTAKKQQIPTATEFISPAARIPNLTPAVEASVPENTKIHTPSVEPNAEAPVLLESVVAAEPSTSDAISDPIQNKRPNSESAATAPSSKRRQFGVITKEEYEAKNKKLEETKELETEDEVAWEPPEGQTGDGKTSLNAKFGY